MTGYDETTPPPPLDPFEEIANEAKRREFAAKIKELEARVSGAERAQPPRLTASTISDDDLDQLYTERDRDTATLAEIRRVVEKIRDTQTGSQAADVVMQALTAKLLDVLGPVDVDTTGGFYPTMTGGRCVAYHLADMRDQDEHPCEAPASACDCECRTAALDGTTPQDPA